MAGVFTLVIALRLVAMLWLSAAPPATAPRAPTFVLKGLDGSTVESARLTGKPFGVFFGFTNCPVVCPTTMTELSGWLAELGEAGKELKFYFVTLDPERDTPQKLKDYLENFSPRLVGLTGTPEEIAAAAKNFSVYYKKVPTSGGYTLDHTALIFLIDAQGRWRGVLDYNLSRSVALEKLRALLAATPGPS
ncbi:protein SCO1/2 [Rhodoblastus acidophilus]|uniref:SCO family protein n=1 Tax=Rhodoblastus acidophilus TaxID=1074 RepID=UPI00222467FB|nr:SCO family protein [Rhodoblastus acidophilus]MCW2283997.1 protein SCO1/2 [Rhodoblastus acidophilus]MCW2332693.1 protein SCO1/2 [Rhodoblastus acidophilus]